MKGLNNQQLKENIEKYGLNKLTEEKKKNPILVVLQQFMDPLTILLLIAAAISFMTGEIPDVIIILSVVAINAIIGSVQELKAEKALEALKQMSSPTAIVIRDGKETEIPAEEITIGDYVILEAGRVVPADIKLTECASLKINESALTGESVPVEKDHLATVDENAPLAERKNCCFSSTLVTYGRGEGEVIGIAENTEIGKIAKMLSTVKEEQTPLQKNLSKLSSILGIAGIVLCILMFGFLYFVDKNPIMETLMLAISFAVAVIPESLATVVTIVLSLGVKRMVKNNAIVKQLQAVETLGAVNVICSDKTGTLTQNKMTVMQYFFNNKLVENSTIEKDNHLLTGFILCNDAKVTDSESLGDPTEIALIDFANKNDYSVANICSEHPRINEFPFDSDRKMMTTVHKFGNDTISFTKGAIESILPACKKILIEGKERDITKDDIKLIEDTALGMSSDALRVLVLAQKSGNDLSEKDLTFLGLVGMIDPAKEGVKETIEIAHNAGIDVVMITGDNKITAFAIAKELNICNDINQCMSGQEIDQMDDETFRKNILNYRVFARVSPEHKVKIVQAFKSHNKICSMTGKSRCPVIQ